MDPTHRIVPAPVSADLAADDPFVLAPETRIFVHPGAEGEEGVARLLAAGLRASTGFALPVERGAPPAPENAIVLRVDAGRTELGDEGYELETGRAGVTLAAGSAAGLFRGVQTLRQLFPPEIEAHDGGRRAGPWELPRGRVADRPRFRWRGVMLDVARHFIPVDDVKRFVDEIAMYKLNVLHLHLTDDQGWRLEIRSHPRLTEVSGRTEVGGGKGGFYTQEEFADLLRYAAGRHVAIVPEIDVPGHTHAALAACPELNAGGVAPEPYTGTRVGFSALRVDDEATFRVLDDVLAEVAALTPGPFLHIGGDEVETIGDEAYAGFILRVQEMVAAHGKRMIGWGEAAKAALLPGALVQHWRGDVAVRALARGARLILSPATKVYLDMKYDAGTELGIDWAGRIDVGGAYRWDPASLLEGAGEADIEGVEAPIWSETLRNLSAVEYMAFPRLPAIAEVGWTPAAGRDWEEFRVRLAAQAPRWRLMGINFHRSKDIPWESC
jgi:hexosaminidase